MWRLLFEGHLPFVVQAGVFVFVNTCLSSFLFALWVTVHVAIVYVYAIIVIHLQYPIDDPNVGITISCMNGLGLLNYLN